MFILPIVVAVVIVSGTLASLSSRAAVVGVATRLMAYKAEQLRDFAYSEWELLVDLELDDEAAFRETVEASFQTYATSLLRSDSELVFAVDADHRIVHRAGSGETLPGLVVGEELPVADGIGPGWIEVEINGASRVGVAFSFEPFDWTVAVTEAEETFFDEAERIRFTHALILLFALLIATIFVSVYISYIIRPIEHLTSTIRGIAESGDLSNRIATAWSDEVGVLAREFNTMIASLESNVRQLKETARAEQEARQTAVEREEETLLLLGRASEYRDEETGEHLERVGALCEQISRFLGQSEEEQKRIRRSSPLHDIGKIAIPDSILLKSGRLSEQEFAHMKMHTQYGHSLLKEAKSMYLIEGAEIALTHHEHWDGSGYPCGLAGEEIPLSGRIVGLVDVFDALCFERRYKAAWKAEDALRLIVSERGSHFDPQLVDLFEREFDTLRRIILK